MNTEQYYLTEVFKGGYQWILNYPKTKAMKITKFSLSKLNFLQYMGWWKSNLDHFQCGELGRHMFLLYLYWFFLI
jgi:hypothetical protein